MAMGPFRSPSRTATLRIVTGLRGSMPPDVLSLLAAQQVLLGRLLGGTAVGDSTLAEDDGVLAETYHRVDVVADEEHRPAAAGHLLDAGMALRLEGRVTHSEHFVEKQDFRIEVRRDCEGEPDLHPRRVALDRDVDELANPGELDYLVELPFRLGSRHAEDRPVEKDVVAAAQLRVKACPHLEETANTTMDLGASRARFGDPA